MREVLEHRKNLIYTYSGPPPTEPELLPGFEIVRATADILDECMQEPELESRKMRYKRFLDLGAIGFLALNDARWAAAGWIAPPTLRGQPYQIPEKWSSHYQWLFEAHTYPPFRGKGLHKALVVRRLRHLADENAGVADAVADVNPANTASRRSYQRLGFKESGIVDVWTLDLPRLRKRPFGVWRKKAPHPPIIVEGLTTT